MVKYKAAMVSAAVAAALVAAPVSSASAHGRHGVFFGVAAAGAAVVVGAATLLTAPIAIVTAPFRAPYYPAPAYYPPPAPAYYYPPAPAYYAPPPAYYYPPGYYAPR